MKKTPNKTTYLLRCESHNFLGTYYISNNKCWVSSCSTSNCHVRHLISKKLDSSVKLRQRRKQSDSYVTVFSLFL